MNPQSTLGGDPLDSPHRHFGLADARASDYEFSAMAMEQLDPDKLWLTEERQKVIDYLEAEGCRHAGVADWPTFYVDFSLALWPVQSTRHTGRTGWWAISGDVPIDYMSSSDGEDPRDALKHFAAEWEDVAGYMRRGESHPTLEMGNPKDWQEMAELLEQRALTLREYADDTEIWES